MKISLNNRHKAGLFLTTVVAGLCLILGEDFRESLGVIIIGCALTWAYGSGSRLLRYSIGTIAVLAILTPTIVSLVDHHTAVTANEQSVTAYRASLPSLAKEYPDDPLAGIGTPVPTSDPGSVKIDPSTGERITAPTEHNAASDFGFRPAYPTNRMRILAIPNIGNIAFPANMSSKEIAKALRAEPEGTRAPYWYLEALDAGISPNEVEKLVPPSDSPASFDLKAAVVGGFLIEIPAAFLAFLFFGSILVESKRSVDMPQ
jgi:hypothetical protein